MNTAAFLAYCFIVTFTPGPTNIVILSTVQNHGPKKALEYTAGAALAFGLLLILSVTFNSVLFVALPKIKLVMGGVGAVYMLYLAWKLSKMDVSAAETTAETDQVGISFKEGFLMQFINPKVVLFVLTVISNFIMPYYSSLFHRALFVLIITIIGLAAFVSWVIFGAILKYFLHTYQKTVNLVMSLSLIYCAFMVSGLQELLLR